MVTIELHEDGSKVETVVFESLELWESIWRDKTAVQVDGYWETDRIKRLSIVDMNGKEVTCDTRYGWKQRVMTVQHVMHVKGTQLFGKLEVDVKIRENVLVDGKLLPIFAIATGLTETSASAVAGQEVALMFVNANIKDAQVGWVVNK